MIGHDPSVSLLPATEGGAAIQPMRGGGKQKEMKGGGGAEDHIANLFLKRVLVALETESREFTANGMKLTKSTETTIR